MHTSELRNFFTSGEWQQDLNFDNPIGHGGNIAQSFFGLLKEASEESGDRSSRYSYYGSIRPGMIHGNLTGTLSSFSNYRQHDAQEFVTTFLDALHEDLNKILKKPYIEIPDYDESKFSCDEYVDQIWNETYLKRNHSFISQLFCGLTKSTLYCPECENISIKFDPIMHLLLPIKHNGRVKEKRRRLQQNRKRKQQQRDERMRIFGITHGFQIRRCLESQGFYIWNDEFYTKWPPLSSHKVWYGYGYGTSSRVRDNISRFERYNSNKSIRLRMDMSYWFKLFNQYIVDIVNERSIKNLRSVNWQDDDIVADILSDYFGRLVEENEDPDTLWMDDDTSGFWSELNARRVRDDQEEDEFDDRNRNRNKNKSRNKSKKRNRNENWYGNGKGGKGLFARKGKSGPSGLAIVKKTKNSNLNKKRAMAKNGGSGRNRFFRMLDNEVSNGMSMYDDKENDNEFHEGDPSRMIEIVLIPRCGSESVKLNIELPKQVFDDNDWESAKSIIYGFIQDLRRKQPIKEDVDEKVKKNENDKNEGKKEKMAKLMKYYEFKTKLFYYIDNDYVRKADPKLYEFYSFFLLWYNQECLQYDNLLSDKEKEAIKLEINQFLKNRTENGQKVISNPRWDEDGKNDSNNSNNRQDSDDKKNECNGIDEITKNYPVDDDNSELERFQEHEYILELAREYEIDDFSDVGICYQMFEMTPCYDGSEIVWNYLTQDDLCISDLHQKFLKDKQGKKVTIDTLLSFTMAASRQRSLAIQEMSVAFLTKPHISFDLQYVFTQKVKEKTYQSFCKPRVVSCPYKIMKKNSTSSIFQIMDCMAKSMIAVECGIDDVKDINKQSKDEEKDGDNENSNDNSNDNKNDKNNTNGNVDYRFKLWLTSKTTRNEDLYDPQNWTDVSVSNANACEIDGKYIVSDGRYLILECNNDIYNKYSNHKMEQEKKEKEYGLMNKLNNQCLLKQLKLYDTIQHNNSNEFGMYYKMIRKQGGKREWDEDSEGSMYSRVVENDYENGKLNDVAVSTRVQGVRGFDDDSENEDTNSGHTASIFDSSSSSSKYSQEDTPCPSPSIGSMSINSASPQPPGLPGLNNMNDDCFPNLHFHCGSENDNDSDNHNCYDDYNNNINCMPGNFGPWGDKLGMNNNMGGGYGALDGFDGDSSDGQYGSKRFNHGYTSDGYNDKFNDGYDGLNGGYKDYDIFSNSRTNNGYDKFNCGGGSNENSNGGSGGENLDGFAEPPKKRRKLNNGAPAMEKKKKGKEKGKGQGKGKNKKEKKNENGNKSAFRKMNEPLPASFECNKAYADNLQEAFGMLLEKERLNDENRWRCAHCKEWVLADKKLDLWWLPDTLIVALKRFEFNGRSKVEHFVHFPLNGLDLSAIVKGKSNLHLYKKTFIHQSEKEKAKQKQKEKENEQEKDNAKVKEAEQEQEQEQEKNKDKENNGAENSKKMEVEKEENEKGGKKNKKKKNKKKNNKKENVDDEFIYDLYATVDHGGSLSFGHYTANVKFDGEWYHISDSSVHSISPNQVVSSSAYILFYRKRRRQEQNDN